MGYDAFGLPAENNAIKTGEHPRDATWASIEEFRRQFRRWGVSIDWTREVATCEPAYYRWTQWIFLRLFERGLAYRAEAPVQWCPVDQTVLANEQVIDGRCERCGSLVEQRSSSSGSSRSPTTPTGCSRTSTCSSRWPEHVVTMQRNWIGRSEGAEVTFRCEELDLDFPVFTTRPDTLFGATFFVLAPEHPEVERLAAGTGHEDAVRDYVNEAAASRPRSAAPRTAQKTGVAARAHGHQPGQRRADPDVRLRLRADGVRDRRDHGGARARRARLRVRQGVRPPRSSPRVVTPAPTAEATSRPTSRSSPTPTDETLVNSGGSTA